MRSRLAVCGALILLIGACAALKPATSSLSTQGPTPASTARQTTPTPVAALTSCTTLPVGTSPTSTQALVLGRLFGSTDWVVRDVTDVNNPATLASLGDRWRWADQSGGTTLDARLIDPATVVWADRNAAGSLVESAANGSGLKTIVPGKSGNAIVSFAWSPAGRDWTYLVNTPAALEWHLVAAGRDRVLVSLPPIPPHGGRPIVDPLMVSYSRDGTFLAMIDYDRAGIGGGGDQAKMQIRRADGTLLTTDAQPGLSGGIISDIIWVNSSLFFRDLSGIEVWSQSGVCSALPGVQWIRPKLSPNGKLIAFHTEDANGLPHVYVLDLSTGTVRQASPGGGAEPWFIGHNYLWFLEERLCAANEPCGSAYGQSELTGKTLIANLATGAASGSRIARIADTFPRPGQPNFDNMWWMDASVSV